MSDVTDALEAWRAAARELDATMPWTAAWLRARMVEEKRRLAYQALAAERAVEMDVRADPIERISGRRAHLTTR